MKILTPINTTFKSDKDLLKFYNAHCGKIKDKDKHCKCVMEVYTYLGGGEYTLDLIGKILKITRERVRQIENSAIKKLKHPRIGRSLRDYTHE